MLISSAERFIKIPSPASTESVLTFIGLNESAIKTPTFILPAFMTAVEMKFVLNVLTCMVPMVSPLVLISVIAIVEKLPRFPLTVSAITLLVFILVASICPVTKLGTIKFVTVSVPVERVFV